MRQRLLYVVAMATFAIFVLVTLFASTAKPAFAQVTPPDPPALHSSSVPWNSSSEGRCPFYGCGSCNNADSDYKQDPPFSERTIQIGEVTRMFWQFDDLDDEGSKATLWQQTNVGNQLFLTYGNNDNQTHQSGYFDSVANQIYLFDWHMGFWDLQKHGRIWWFDGCPNTPPEITTEPVSRWVDGTDAGKRYVQFILRDNDSGLQDVDFLVNTNLATCTTLTDLELGEKDIVARCTETRAGGGFAVAVTAYNALRPKYTFDSDFPGIDYSTSSEFVLSGNGLETDVPTISPPDPDKVVPMAPENQPKYVLITIQDTASGLRKIIPERDPYCATCITSEDGADCAKTRQNSCNKGDASSAYCSLSTIPICTKVAWDGFTPGMIEPVTVRIEQGPNAAQNPNWYFGAHLDVWDMNGNYAWQNYFFDLMPPSCLITQLPKTELGQERYTYTIQDAGNLMSGLAQIRVTEQSNVTLDPAPGADNLITAFESGTQQQVVVTETQRDIAWPAMSSLIVTDLDGNVTDCDPSIQRVPIYLPNINR